MRRPSAGGELRMHEPYKVRPSPAMSHDIWEFSSRVLATFSPSVEWPGLIPGSSNQKDFCRLLRHDLNHPHSAPVRSSPPGTGLQCQGRRRGCPARSAPIHGARLARAGANGCRDAARSQPGRHAPAAQKQSSITSHRDPSKETAILKRIRPGLNEREEPVACELF